MRKSILEMFVKGSSLDYWPTRSQVVVQRGGLSTSLITLCNVHTGRISS